MSQLDDNSSPRDGAARIKRGSCLDCGAELDMFLECPKCDDDDEDDDDDFDE